MIGNDVGLENGSDAYKSYSTGSVGFGTELTHFFHP